MTFVAAAIIGSSVVGGIASSRAASKQARAQRDVADTQAEAFRFSKPYIKETYEGGQAALADVLNRGAYGGQTYAAPDPFQLSGNIYAGNVGRNVGQGALDAALASQDYASNFGDLYGRAMGDDRMAIAQQYAIDNANPLVNAAMRDDFRNLTENTLRNTAMGAQGTGNTNASTKAVADAIANRGFQDRLTDTTARIQDNLIDRSIAQQGRQFDDALEATQGMGRSYLDSLNASQKAAELMTGAGRNLRGFDQGYLNDLRAAYERDRDFALDNQIKYRQGILGDAVYQSPQSPQGVYADPTAAGFGGAIQGAGIGMDLAKFFKDMKEG
tara:strand:+ start:1479 stop:2462 length:984 start_codon:yes stop_codon:yes gene_type:complete